MKLANIKTLRIDGTDIAIKLVEPRKELDGHVAFGMFKADSNNIEICRVVSEDRQLQILFHELVHVISYHRCYDIGLSETQTQAIAVGLLQVLLDNPQLIELLRRKK